MILLFCLERTNVFSYGDLAILRGMRMVYHHKTIDRVRFDRYRKRFSAYCSVASLYFWAVAGGTIPEMKNYATEKKK
jgi:DNA-3-methyladenine glycosylase II